MVGLFDTEKCHDTGAQIINNRTTKVCHAFDVVKYARYASVFVSVSMCRWVSVCE